MKTRSHHHYHHHNPNSPRYLWGVGVEKTRKRTTREKRKNVNEPAGSSSSSFYPSRVGALRQKRPPRLSVYRLRLFVMNNRISRSLLIHFGGGKRKFCCCHTHPEAVTLVRVKFFSHCNWKSEFLLGEGLARIQHANCGWVSNIILE
jgi:hypothetical protein